LKHTIGGYEVEDGCGRTYFPQSIHFLCFS